MTTFEADVIPQSAHERSTDDARRAEQAAAAVEQARRAAFAESSDPLFFKWQRGEATEQEWLDKVQQIRERYPENNEGEK